MIQIENLMNTLGIFVKHPLPGRVKTRLAAEIGESAATACYEAFVRDIVEKFQTTGESRHLCYAPDGQPAETYFQSLAGSDYNIWPQPDSTLGARLQQFFDDAFANSANSVIVIGSDSPSLPVEFITSAFEQLQHVDCVIGPAIDGGYYLFGQRGTSHPLFADINWSQPTVFAETIARIQNLQLSYSVLNPWYDIDTRADLTFLKNHLTALRQSTDGDECLLNHTWTQFQ